MNIAYYEINIVLTCTHNEYDIFAGDGYSLNLKIKVFIFKQH
jgi:hypothetical protein